MRGEGQHKEEGQGENNHHGEVILGSHMGASPMNSLNLTYGMEDSRFSW